MIRIALAVTCLALAGCGNGGPSAAVSASTSTSPGTQPDSTVQPKAAPKEPDFAHESRLAIVKRSGTVRVGDTYDQVLAVFPEPRGAFNSVEVPASLPGGYRSRVWETSSEGLGVILFRDRVAVALYTLRRGDWELLRETVSRHEQAFPSIAIDVVSGERANYWFWEEGPQRLMICGFQPRSGETQITVALGDIATMNALRIGSGFARKDQDRLKEIIEGLSAPSGESG
jgi:hypothetical protein